MDGKTDGQKMDKGWSEREFELYCSGEIKKNLSLTIMINKFNYHAVVHLFSSRLLVNTHKVRKS